MNSLAVVLNPAPGPACPCADHYPVTRVAFTPDAWRAKLEEARRLGCDEVLLAGPEPLAVPGVATVLAAVPWPEGLALAVETHGGFNLGQGLTLARTVPGACLRLTVHGELPLPRPLAVMPGMAVVVPSPQPSHWPALPAGLLRLARATERERPPLLVDRTVPPCLRRGLPFQETALPRFTPPLPREYISICDDCPDRASGRCPGWAGGARLRAGQARRLRALNAVPDFAPDHAEGIALRLGLRQAFRLVVPASHLPQAQATLRHSGHAVLASPRLVQDADGNLYPPRPGDAAGDHVILYVGAVRATLVAVAGAEARILARGRGAPDPADHWLLGRAFGYPECCIQAFVEDLLQRGREAQSQADHARLVERARARTVHPDPLLTRSGDRDAALISHVPCRFDCPASVELARRIAAARR